MEPSDGIEPSTYALRDQVDHRDAACSSRATRSPLTAALAAIAARAAVPWISSSGADSERSRSHGVFAPVPGPQGSRWVPEFIICTPAESSPSKRVTGLVAPRQPSSSLGSANQKPTELSSLRTLVSLLKANASSTMSWSVLLALPHLSVVMS